MVSALNFSPMATISACLALASASISASRFSALASSLRPCSPAASPSAICFCRVSMARISGGQMKRPQNQMKAVKATACMISVRLKFMTAPCSGGSTGYRTLTWG